MSAGTASPGIVIGRLEVRWRVGAELREADRARLDGLVRELCDGPLEDVLTDVPDEVCIRRVAVPAHRARWDCADAELVSGWAKAIGHAVRASTTPGSDAVRFASRAHAQADLIVSVLAGHHERIWAWQLLGLWPAGNWPDVEAVSRTVAAAVGERPGTLVALAVAAARAGQLGRFAEYLGPAALADFTQRAWLAAGGTVCGRAGGLGSTADAALIDPLAALLHQGSEIVAGTLRLPAVLLADPARPVGPESATVPGSAAPGAADVSGSATAPGSAAASGPAAVPGSPASPGSLAESLAALALLEVEPAMAAHPDAWAAVSATARALLAARARPQSARPGEAGPARSRSPRPGPPSGQPDAEPAGAGDQARPPADGGAAPVPPSAGAATRWGGLLFLLPIVSQLGIPASVTAQPDDYGVGLRPVLHELGRQLLARAAPDAEPADAHDPAVLAFCGLSPGSQAPRPPGAPATRLIALAADALAAALRERLSGPPPRRAGSVLLLGVCRRHAVIHADPGWIDVDLRLDQVSVGVRRAGLDLDPGYLPWLGCVVRFRYV